jgi:N6-L-threonylcarbamoyladenine synthase
MITLGIETSCDDTALALTETGKSRGIFELRVIDSLVHSQAELHSAYGGVYPSLAKREHGKNLVPLLHKLLNQSAEALTRSKQGVRSNDFDSVLAQLRAEVASANPELFESFSHAEFLKDIPAIDRIAVTEGPGLEPALWVGINFARMLSALWKIPIVPVNHMEGHIVGSLLESDIAMGKWQKLKSLPTPAVAFLISGGHTELVRIDDRPRPEGESSATAGNGGLRERTRPDFKYEIIGRTKDDAVGEAFDKAARLLGLPYPGGPHISKLAHEAREAKIASPVKLPRPMMKSGDLDFSFSGLKTAVLYAVRDHAKADGTLDETFKNGLAREFEDAVTETLDAKLRTAIEKTGAKSLIIGGGVSANRTLRERFASTASEYTIPLFLPSQHISGDNALMIALVGALKAAPRERRLKAHGTKRL